jgi:methionine-rich copper-binding protein CopC
MDMNTSLRSFRVREVVRTSRIIVVCAVPYLIPLIAVIYPVLVESTPKMNATVEGPDLAVTMKFSSRVDGARSTVLLSTLDGQLKPLAIEHQSAADTVTTHVNHLSPGKYSIRWQVLATDGHVTRGEIPFRVK